MHTCIAGHMVLPAMQVCRYAGILTFRTCVVGIIIAIEFDGYQVLIYYIFTGIPRCDNILG
jgi:hypothetical protein